MNIKAVIIDDERKGRELLKTLLEEYCTDVEVNGMAGNVADGVKIIKSVQPNIVFLDIEMPGEKGFRLLEYFPEPDFEVVFTTAYSEYALHAFKVAALDYLLKPINIEELQEAVEKYKKQNNRGNSQRLNIFNNQINGNGTHLKQIAIPTPNGFNIIDSSDIIRCEAAKNYSILHLTDKSKIIATKNLGEFEEILSQHGFFRIHHSFIINTRHMKKYVKGKGGYVIMADGSEVDVAARRRDPFLKYISTE